jgi:hypothetical protein
MKSLEALADETTYKAYDIGNDTVEICTYSVRFETANPDRLVNPDLPPTLTVKPLVNVEGESLFGELAILRTIQKDGWDGVWVDTFHQKKLRNSMPPEEGIDLPDHAKRVYNSIVKENKGADGFFDVFAWKDDQYAFLEYKGKGDSLRKTQKTWIGAALRAGINLNQLFIVAYERG